MRILEKIYNNSPIFFQYIMTSVAGYQKNKTRYGNTYYEYRNFLKKFDTLSLEEKVSYQHTELIKFIKYANSNSSFYNSLYKGIDINSIRTVRDLRKLPIVDKELIRSNNIQVNTLSKKNAVVSHTGGTTGKSLEVLFTRDDMMRRMAMLDHFKSRVGFEHLEMKRATFNGKNIIPEKQTSKVFWRYNKACKQMLYSSFHLSEENIGHYVDNLNKFKPDAIDGFFMSMVDIASYIERHSIELKFKPNAIFPTSETITPSGRSLLERVFNCKVYDQYASAEGAPFITECSNQVLHMELSSGIFEHVEEDNNEILVTSFTTHGTPLIRYRIGDSMLFDSETTCSCGNDSPLVKNIYGRKLDFLYSSSGSKVRQPTTAIKKTRQSVIRTQFIQNHMGEVKILLEVDKNSYKNEFDKYFISEMKYKLGESTNVVIEHVESIPRESSGKYRVIKNNVKNPEMV
ncbi:phenylacetate--CoA ligase family protein [Alkalibacterium psychrotolerans]